jgi:hypothetical protein
MDEDDAFLDKAIEGLGMFALNQGEVCTCPSRAFIQESICDRFMERVLKRVAAIKRGARHGRMFSLENGSGVRFLTRSRVFTEAELAALESIALTP